MQDFWLSLHTPKTTLIFPSGIYWSLGCRILSVTEYLSRNNLRSKTARTRSTCQINRSLHDPKRLQSREFDTQGKISFPLQRFAEGATRRSPYQSLCNRHTASNERENHSKFRNGYEVIVFILSREKSTANLIIDSRIQKWRKSTLRSAEKMTKFESVWSN